MTNRVMYLNLPHPSENLITRLIQSVENLQPNLDAIKWVEEYHHNEIKCLSHQYNTEKTKLSDEFHTEINDLYGKFFGCKVKGIVGKLENIYTDSTAQTPPHCDRGRNVAINYILSTGGDDVWTCFYKEKRSEGDPSTPQNIYYKDVTLDFKIKFPSKVWHAYDVQIFHSVENVKDTRIIFTLGPQDDLSIDQFKLAYNHIIQG